MKLPSGMFEAFVNGQIEAKLDGQGGKKYVFRADIESIRTQNAKVKMTLVWLAIGADDQYPPPRWENVTPSNKCYNIDTKDFTIFSLLDGFRSLVLVAKKPGLTVTLYSRKAPGLLKPDEIVVLRHAA